MKALLAIVISAFFLQMTDKCFAQTSATVTSGVYITAKDHKKNKLHLEADCVNDKNKFERNDYFSTPTFVIIHKGKRVTYLKRTFLLTEIVTIECGAFIKNKHIK
ncbi:MAG: hypothetical protein IPJ60_09895 [Sphingobacteriaceae bacterium]|nr:hypothetical protein [Sphingobacteriaceae bacterium]